MECKKIIFKQILFDGRPKEIKNLFGLLRYKSLNWWINQRLQIKKKKYINILIEGGVIGKQEKILFS